MPWNIIFFCTNYFKSCSFRYKMSFSCVSLALGLFQPHARRYVRTRAGTAIPVCCYKHNSVNKQKMQPINKMYPDEKGESVH